MSEKEIDRIDLIGGVASGIGAALLFIAQGESFFFPALALLLGIILGPAIIFYLRGGRFAQ